jgi:hypothetical protein
MIRYWDHRDIAVWVIIWFRRTKEEYRRRRIYLWWGMMMRGRNGRVVPVSSRGKISMK